MFSDDRSVAISFALKMSEATRTKSRGAKAIHWGAWLYVFSVIVTWCS